MFNDVDNELNAFAVASFARLELSSLVLFFAALASIPIASNFLDMSLMLELIAVETEFVILFSIELVASLRP